jgi:hypothetical protein
MIGTNAWHIRRPAHEYKHPMQKTSAYDINRYTIGQRRGRLVRTTWWRPRFECRWIAHQSNAIVDRSDAGSPHCKSPAIEDRILGIDYSIGFKGWVGAASCARRASKHRPPDGSPHRPYRPFLLFAVVAAVVLPFPLPTNLPISAAALSN